MIFWYLLLFLRRIYQNPVILQAASKAFWASCHVISKLLWCGCYFRGGVKAYGLSVLVLHRQPGVHNVVPCRCHSLLCADQIHCITWSTLCKYGLSYWNSCWLVRFCWFVVLASRTHLRPNHSKQVAVRCPRKCTSWSVYGVSSLKKKAKKEREWKNGWHFFLLIMLF